MNKQHFTETQIPDGAFLGILGRGGDLAFTEEIMSSLLRLQQEQYNPFELAYFFFFLTHMELKQ